MNMKVTNEESSFRYIITETGPATSLDPLNADSTRNLPVARMVYATPLEVSKNNRLVSSVLSSFSYDPSTYQIHWEVKEGLTFEGGAPLTASDVSFAVARFAYSRPSFPVIEKISGIQSWRDGAVPLKSLPAGIELNGQHITISFSGPVDHPLFRFCLEIFSIIPRSCVDLESNEIKCEEVPESGYYKVVEKTDSEIHFELRKEVSRFSGETLPFRIKFDYFSTGQLLSQIDEFGSNTVVAGSEVLFSQAETLRIRSSGTVKYLPASRYTAFYLNPEVEPFDDVVCRRVFAKEFRKMYSKHPGVSSPLEESLFTKILPGHFPPGEIELQLRHEDISNCKKKMKRIKLEWALGDSSTGNMISEVVGKALSNLETLDFERKKLSPPLGLQTYLENKSFLYAGGSGFWALDPTGDVKMLFTPGLHRTLEKVTDDPRLKGILKNLKNNRESMLSLNKYLYSEAILNVFTHHRRFYIFFGAVNEVELPMAITSPAPWQVFD